MNNTTNTNNNTNPNEIESYIDLADVDGNLLNLRLHPDRYVSSFIKGGNAHTYQILHVEHSKDHIQTKILAPVTSTLLTDLSMYSSKSTTSLSGGSIVSSSSNSSSNSVNEKDKNTSRLERA